MPLTISIKDKNTFHRLWIEALNKSKNNDYQEFHNLIDKYRGYFGKDFADMIEVMMGYTLCDDLQTQFDSYLKDIDWIDIKDREPPPRTIVHVKCAKGKKHLGVHNSNSTTTMRGIFDCGDYDVWDAESWALNSD